MYIAFDTSGSLDLGIDDDGILVFDQMSNASAQLENTTEVSDCHHSGSEGQDT